MDEKAPDAFRTISEVADELDLPQHVLRFWESRFREIKPMKRGGGRRYYRPTDIDLLRGIRHLLYGQGYTIRGVQRLLREMGVKFVQSVWQKGAVAAPQGIAPREEFAEELLALEATGTEPIADSDFGEQQHSIEGRREPQFDTAMQPHAFAAISGTLAPDDLNKLQAALKELMECRDLIASVPTGERS